MSRLRRLKRKYLANAAKLEVESSRQELILAQTQFQEASSQQSAQINSLRNALSNAEVRDSAVREDLRCLRNESESYSQLFENAKHNWQRMQLETRTADQLARTQRSELNAALSEVSTSQSVTDELYGQFCRVGTGAGKRDRRMQVAQC